jgi:SpoIID/LytB domain protein
MGVPRLDRDGRVSAGSCSPRVGIVSTYHRVRALLAALAVALTLALTVVPAFGATPASAAMLIVEGAGDGHGVGMSQDGALGYAEHGWTDAQILAHYYTGTTVGQAPANAVVKVLEGAKVVTLPLERYVRGVVSAEMPASWPMAALEAQAIASRTYALTSDAGGARFDVYADTRSQVYESPPTPAAETASTNAAVAATARQVVEYEGKPAITYYFASSGGMTEDNENSFIGSTPEPWLRGVADAYETTAADWRVTMSFATAAARLSGLVKGALRGIEVLARGVSPRIVAAEVLGSRGTTQVSGPELEARLGLASAWAYFSVRRGAMVVREPDVSGHAPFTPPAAETPPAATPSTAPSTTPTPTPQGGSPAPATTASLGDLGGVQAQ